MNLRVRHSTRIKPHVNQIEFAFHRFTLFGNQNNIVNVRTVQVNLFVIILIVFARNKSFFFVRVRSHQSGSYRFFYFVIEFLYRFNAYFLTIIFRSPDRQRCAPVARATKVPVIEVFKPFTETACSGRFRFPVNGFVQFHHTLFASGRTDEPTVERIIKHRLVCSPAMRIVVHMLLYLERLVRRLHHHANGNIQ